jgi:hypothetical protein
MSISERRVFWWAWSVVTMAVVAAAWHFMTNMTF